MTVALFYFALFIHHTLKVRRAKASVRLFASTLTPSATSVSSAWVIVLSLFFFQRMCVRRMCQKGLCIHIHTCVYIYIHVYICMYTFTYIYIHTHLLGTSLCPLVVALHTHTHSQNEGKSCRLGLKRNPCDGCRAELLPHALRLNQIKVQVLKSHAHWLYLKTGQSKTSSI
uniref:Uncharacterized protein n=1 Tax=Oryzias melastigma TaxID=30732 RepID=A0A3B3D577_ORYME